MLSLYNRNKIRHEELQTKCMLCKKETRVKSEPCGHFTHCQQCYDDGFGLKLSSNKPEVPPAPTCPECGVQLEQTSLNVLVKRNLVRIFTKRRLRMDSNLDLDVTGDC